MRSLLTLDAYSMHAFLTEIKSSSLKTLGEFFLKEVGC